MKKIVSFVLVVFFSFSIFMIAGCGSKTPTESTEEINVNLPSDYEARITVSTSTGFMNDLEKVKQAFNKYYPNITVVIKPQPNNNQQIISWHNADKARPGSSPDIFWFPNIDFPNLASGGILKDLTPYFNAAVEAGKIDKEDLVEEYFNLGRLGFKEEGNLYMLPTHRDQIVCFINTTIFKWAGIEIPSDDWTWDEFVVVAQKLKEHYEKNGWGNICPVTAHLEAESTIYPIMMAHGVEFFDEDNNVILNNAKTKAALQFMKDMNDQGYAKYNHNGAVAGGQVAIQFQSRPALIMPGEIEGAEFPNAGYFGVDDFNVVSFPKIMIDGVNKPAVGGGTHGYSMYRYTKNPNAAWAFLQFLYTQEAQNLLGEAGRHVPMLKSMHENDEPGEE